jgi:hypothetical protein
VGIAESPEYEVWVLLRGEIERLHRVLVVLNSRLALTATRAPSSVGRTSTQEAVRVDELVGYFRER